MGAGYRWRSRPRLEKRMINNIFEFDNKIGVCDPSPIWWPAGRCQLAEVLRVVNTEKFSVSFMRATLIS